MCPKRLGIVLVMICLYFSVQVISAQEQIVFRGVGGKTTAPFECYGHCLITWEAKPVKGYEENAVFFVTIKKPGATLFESSFSGLSGETHFYKAGIWVFDVMTTFCIESWEIQVENLLSVVSEIQEFGTPAVLTLCILFAVLLIARR